MKFLSLLSLLVITACGNGNTSSKSYNENRELVPNPEGHQKDTFPSDTITNPPPKDSANVTKKKK